MSFSHLNNCPLILNFIIIPIYFNVSNQSPVIRRHKFQTIEADLLFQNLPRILANQRTTSPLKVITNRIFDWCFIKLQLEEERGGLMGLFNVSSQID